MALHCWQMSTCSQCWLITFFVLLSLNQVCSARAGEQRHACAVRASRMLASRLSKYSVLAQNCSAGAGCASWQSSASLPCAHVPCDVSYSTLRCTAQRRRGVAPASSTLRQSSVKAEPRSIRHKAPRKRMSTRLRNVADKEPTYTVPQWHDAMARFGADTETALQLAKALQSFPRSFVQADVPHYLGSTMRLLRHVPAASGQEARLLDAVAQCFAMHPVLLRAADADADASALLDRALDDAAAADGTYMNERGTTQMVTAQLKLRRYCVVFRQRLEQRGLRHLMPRQLATVVHRAAVLTEQLRAPPPSAPLWAAMEGAMAKHASGMRAQEVSNCFLACAKLGRRPDSEAARKLLRAAEKASTSMESQSVANVLWALAKLGLPVGGPLRSALFSAVLLTSEEMDAQPVANTLWALANLGAPVEHSLRTTLVAAALRTAVGMNVQDLANTLHALAGLRIQPSQELSDALLDVASRQQHALNGQGVGNTLRAVAMMRLRVSPQARDALLDAALRTSASDMDMRHVSSTLSSLNKLRWRLGGELQGGLCAAVVRTSPQMDAQAVALTLLSWSCLELQSTAAAQRSLSVALDRTATGLTPQGASMCVAALRQLHWPVRDDTRAAIDAKLAC